MVVSVFVCSLCGNPFDSNSSDFVLLFFVCLSVCVFLFDLFIELLCFLIFPKRRHHFLLGRESSNQNN